MTPAQIAAVCAQAGFRGDALVTIVAIAHAESTDYSDNIGDVGLETSTWGPSVGLFQVRTYQPAYLARHYDQWRDRSKLDGNPLYQAQAAYAISSGGTNFHPWTTYTDGAYLAYIGEAQAAVGQIGSTPTVAPTSDAGKGNAGSSAWGALVGGLGAVPGIGAPIAGAAALAGGAKDAAHAVMSIPDFLGKLTDPAVWMRVAKVIAGILAILAGALILSEEAAGPAVSQALPAVMAAAA